MFIVYDKYEPLDIEAMIASKKIAFDVAARSNSRWKWAELSDYLALPEVRNEKISYQGEGYIVYDKEFPLRLEAIVHYPETALDIALYHNDGDRYEWYFEINEKERSIYVKQIKKKAQWQLAVSLPDHFDYWKTVPEKYIRTKLVDEFFKTPISRKLKFKGGWLQGYEAIFNASIRHPIGVTIALQDGKEMEEIPKIMDVS
jgi:hypothetical protein